jgi:hypothetical protein
MAEGTDDRVVQLGWRVPARVKFQFKELAAQRGTTVEAVGLEALRHYLLDEAQCETAKVRRERARREWAEREARP